MLTVEKGGWKKLLWGKHVCEITSNLEESQATRRVYLIDAFFGTWLGSDLVGLCFSFGMQVKTGASLKWGKFERMHEKMMEMEELLKKCLIIDEFQRSFIL